MRGTSEFYEFWNDGVLARQYHAKITKTGWFHTNGSPFNPEHLKIIHPCAICGRSSKNVELAASEVLEHLATEHNTTVDAYIEAYAGATPGFEDTIAIWHE